jgi:hypothetical protein
MRKEATLEQWKKLYDVAIKIKELQPWEHLWDLDIITLIIPGREMIYNSVMGRGRECYGIGSYISDKAINNFHNMLESKNFPIEQTIRFQDDDIIMCYFGSRDELTAKELKLIKDLGYKFRGKNNWIYFHSFKKGYAPFMLDQEEVLLETKILQHLYMSLNIYIIEGLKVDFENGRSLTRTWSEKEGLWMNFEAPLMRPEEKYLAPTIEDEDFKFEADIMETTEQIWELDIAYTSGAIKDKEYERPVSIRICILAESKSGIMLDQDILTPDDNEASIILNMVSNQMFDLEKPSKILVRDKATYYIIKDICNVAKIKLEIKERLKTIDSFLREFATGRFG